MKHWQSQRYVGYQCISEPCSLPFQPLTHFLHSLTLQVQPTTENQAKKRKARAAYRAAKLGLKIVATPKARRLVGDVGISLAHGDYRTEAPSSSQELYDFSTAVIESLSTAVDTTNATITNEERKIRRYRQAAGKDFGAAVTLSAFDSLQALSNGEAESTMCCICLDTLGSNDGRDHDDDESETAASASISMTKCGVSQRVNSS